MPSKPRRTGTATPAKPKAVNLRIRNLAPDLVEHYTAKAARNGRSLPEELKATLYEVFAINPREGTEPKLLKRSRSAASLPPQPEGLKSNSRGQRPRGARRNLHDPERIESNPPTNRFDPIPSGSTRDNHAISGGDAPGYAIAALQAVNSTFALHPCAPNCDPLRPPP